MNTEKLLDDVLERVRTNPDWFGRKLACKELEDALEASEASLDAARDAAYSEGWDSAIEDMEDALYDRGRGEELADVLSYLRAAKHGGTYDALADALEKREHIAHKEDEQRARWQAMKTAVSR